MLEDYSVDYKPEDLPMVLSSGDPQDDLDHL